MSTFIFDGHTETHAAHRAELPTNIHTEAALFDALAETLCFPDYFGRNWDAVEECIRDLTWLPPGDVVLSHQDVPLSENTSSLSIYLSILKDAVERWKRTGGRNLLIVFPSQAEGIVQRAQSKL